MTDQHPITPPPELVKQWWNEAQQADYSDGLPCWLNYVATQAARWGADQELEACCEWLVEQGWFRSSNHEGLVSLRAARRPKPQSLKEQALLAIDTAVADGRLSPDVSNVIRRALETLDD